MPGERVDHAAIWEKAGSTTPEQIVERSRIYSDRFGRKIELSHPEVAAAFDKEEMAECLAVNTLPPEIQEVWQLAFQVKTEEEYDSFVDSAKAVNPYLQDESYSVGGKIGRLRTIGWAYYVLDQARIVAAANVVDSHPERHLYSHYIGYVGGLYWNEGSHWDIWANVDIGWDENLEEEDVLKRCIAPELSHLAGPPWWRIVKARE